MGEEDCTRCGQRTVLRGAVIDPEAGIGNRFDPRDSRIFRKRTGVALSSQEFRACVSCGLVWSSLDPDRLRAFVLEYGEEVAKQEIDEFDRGPMRDLPDTALTRSIAAKVAELDALARDRRVGVVGRYRDMKGVAWDVALAEAGQWRRLARAEKLALFGWIPKEKPLLDDLDSPFP